jgi:hypothetical protein
MPQSQVSFTWTLSVLISWFYMLDIIWKDLHRLSTEIWNELFTLDNGCIFCYLSYSSLLFLQSWVHKNLTAHNILLTASFWNRLTLLALSFLQTKAELGFKRFLRLKLLEDCSMALGFHRSRCSFKLHFYLLDKSLILALAVR